MQKSPRKPLGFTLLELVMVIVIIASVSVVVTVRFGAKGDHTAAFQADLLVSKIRHMQGLAMTWGVPLRMNISATAYNVSCVANTNPPCNTYPNPVQDPAEFQVFSVTLQDNLVLSGMNLEIDSLGRPRDPVTHAVLGTAQTLSLVVGTTKWNLTIYPITADITLLKV